MATHRLCPRAPKRPRRRRVAQVKLPLLLPPPPPQRRLVPVLLGRRPLSLRPATVVWLPQRRRATSPRSSRATARCSRSCTTRATTRYSCAQRTRCALASRTRRSARSSVSAARTVRLPHKPYYSYSIVLYCTSLLVVKYIRVYLKYIYIISIANAFTFAYCVCRQEPLPGLPVQGLVQHEELSLFARHARVRPRPLQELWIRLLFYHSM